MNKNWFPSMPDKLKKKNAEVAEGNEREGGGGVYKFEIKNKNKLKSEQ